MIWLPLYVLFYTLVTLYWARIAAQANGNDQTYFSAGHDLQPWVSALVIAGASLSGWVVLGGASEVARHGFGQPALLQAGIALALPGVLFFKRLWLVGERLRLSSQAEVFRAYYRSEFLVVVSTMVAVLFAVGFAGMQLRALSGLVAQLTGGAVTAPVVGLALSAVMFGYVVIGGMRAIGYLGAVQTLLLAAALIGLAGFALVGLGGFDALNAGLVALAADPTKTGLFTVAGVIQFTAGIGREAAAGHEGTAFASLGLLVALMGFQASPLAAKIVMSTRSPAGLAAGQTWVLAGVGGALVVGCMTVLGAAALIDPGLAVPRLLATTSPWFSAWLFVGLLAGVQLVAGLALFTAAEALVRHIYKPWFRSSLNRQDTVTITRVVIGVLALISVAMQTLTPVTLSAFGALALPLAVQLWVPLLGICWLGWFGRGAVLAGVGFGIAGVLLTEPAGHAMLSYLGLDLPWGRWPWTIHSALWGIVPNLCVTLLLSAVTRRIRLGEKAQDIRHLLDVTLRSGPKVRALQVTAWSVVLAWVFLAAGPGLIFGNTAFVSTDGAWLLGMPSLWGWALLFWAAGLGMVWFLSYKMELASPLTIRIPPYAPKPRLRHDQTKAEAARLRTAVITVVAGFGIGLMTVLSFGG